MDVFLLNWNVRGLNNPAKRRAVQIFLSELKCNFICFQETKLAQVDRAIVLETLGARFSDNFIFKPATGTRGGLLIACTQDFSIQHEPLADGDFSISGLVTDRSDGSSWTMTGVYGPQEDPDKILFLQELRLVKQFARPEWLLIGDFNLITKVEEKSSGAVNLQMMGRFNALIGDLELIDYPLIGRCFTWSNEREDATMTRIDRILVTEEWEARYPGYQLTPASSSSSDHCPLLLQPMEIKHFKGFRFENSWLARDGFLEVVTRAWSKPVAGSDHVQALHIKLSRVSRVLRAWNKEHSKKSRLLSALANDIIFQFDKAQEERSLSAEEVQLRRDLKARLLGLAAVERARWRQRSRLTWVKEGDASTRLFHLKASGRRRRNHIPSLTAGGQTVHGHGEKAGLLFEHFKGVLGSPDSTDFGLNWETLQLPRLDLEHLEEAFTIEELKKAIFDSPVEKAPGPDGFTGGFFRKCWEVVKADLLKAFNQLHCLRGRHWNLLNTAHLALLPKRVGAAAASDFRPISLMHSAAKLMCKLLANRLAPELPNLISLSQSAFVKGRSIQDNFLYVQNMIKEAHQKKKPLIFLKLDIARAFDSVNWGYLLETMKAFGFGPRWRDLVSLLLSSSSSRVLLNGLPGKSFRHLRGLRQGDPLSPFLFLLAIEPLQRIFQLATSRGLLSRLPLRNARLRTSLYADDAALFLNPVKQEVDNAQAILARFGLISGMKANFQKCTAYKIRCDLPVHEGVLDNFGGNEGVLPCKYLGLPLGFKKPRRVEVQPLLDRAAAKVPPWQGKLFNRMGRLSLVNSTLSAIFTYYLTCFPLDKWAVKKIDKIRRSFLWAGDTEASGSKCLVNWKQVCAPRSLGGLGVKDMEAYSRSLRLRWLWFEWDDKERPWRGTAVPCDTKDRRLFASCTLVTLGDGKTARFWESRWLGGCSPGEIAPALTTIAWRKNLTVAEALNRGRWMQGLQRMTSDEQLNQFVALWVKVQEVVLSTEKDSIRWNRTGGGVYSAKSAYQGQFIGRICAPELGKVWAMRTEQKVKFYVWLMLQNRNWTSDRLARRGWPHSALCCFCDQTGESAVHLLLLCPFAKEIWLKVAGDMPRLASISQGNASIKAWWSKLNDQPVKDVRKKEAGYAA
ncbi:unnamed protein product [Alopecurus aequalis]